MCEIVRIFFSGVAGKKVHFYGNSGVCVFKYLVTMTDPQKWYSVAVLAVNLLCFMLISISYIIIHTKTASSSRSLGGAKNKEFARRNRKLQAKVSAIILTDFLCWIPFTIVCFVHFGGAVDATMWYPIFSNIILPINSVINPLLYDTYIASFFLRPVQSTFRTIRITTMSIRSISIRSMSIRSNREVSEAVDEKASSSKPVGEEIEMKECENAQNCNSKQEY